VVAFVATSLILFAPSLGTAQDRPPLNPLERAVWEKRKDLNEALAKGVVPSDLLEVWRVVPQDSLPAQAYEKQMLEIFKQLYPQWHLEARPVHFLLLRDETEVAHWQYRSANHTYFAMTTAIWKKLESQDEAAFLLADKWKEYASQQDLAEASNEKVQISFAALKLMEDRGFDSRAKETFNSRLPKSPSLKTWFFVGGVSEARTTEEAITRDALSLLDRQRGGLKHERRALSAEVQATRNEARHVSEMNKQLDERGFYNAGTAEKLKILADILRTPITWNAARAEDIKNEIRKFRTTVSSNSYLLDRSKPEEMQAFESLIDAILDLSKGKKDFEYLVAMKATSDFYRVAAMTLSADKIPLLGRLKKLKVAVQEFIEAESYEAAKQTGEELSRVIESEADLIPLLRELDIPNFDFINVENFDRQIRKKTMRVSWNKHVEWAVKDKKHAVLKALWSLGVHDPRLMEELAPSEIIGYVINSDFVISKGPREGSIDIWDLDISDDGELGALRKFTRPEDKRSRIAQAKNSILLRALTQLLKKAYHPDPENSERVEAIETIHEILPRTSYSGFTGTIGTSELEKNFGIWYDLNSPLFGLMGPGQKTATELQREVVDKFRQLNEESKGTGSLITRKFFLGSNDKRDIFHFGMSPGSSRFETNKVSSPFFQYVLDVSDELLTRPEKLRTLEASELSNIAGSDSTKMELSKLRRLVGYEKPKTQAAFFKTIEEFKSEPVIVQTILLVEYVQLLATSKSLKPDYAKLFKAFGSEILNENRDLKRILKNRFPNLKWPEKLEDRIHLWSGAAHADLFQTDNIFKHKTLAAILEDIQKVKEPEKRRELIEPILFGPHIFEPELRDQAMSLWTASIKEIYGKDDDTLRYRSKIRTGPIRQIVQMHPGDRLDLLVRLADELVTQSGLSQDFKVASQQFNAGERNTQSLAGALAFRVLGRDPEVRLRILEFLSSPLTDPNLKSFSVFASEQHLFAIGMNSDKYDFSEAQLPPETYEELSKLSWQNFRSAPLAARAIFLEQLLVPVDDPGFTGIEQAFDYVANRIFPPRAEYSRESREFMRAYFDVIPSYQRGLLLAAMMAAADKSQGREISIGERLALVLELLGPAETKLGQAIHSFPDTPDNVRKGVGRLKSMTNKPTRSELDELYKKYVPAELRGRIANVGEVLGAASYYIVFEVTMKDGSQKVIAVLRDYANERAKNGFNLMLQMTEKLGKDHPLYQTLKDLIEQARDMSDIETNSVISALQTQMAEKLYDGVQVQNEDQTYTFHVAKVLERDEKYRLMERAPGVHFSDLPESTKEEIARKKSIAEAYLTLELSTILRGREFDHDRHGAQMRIEGNHIYLFDFGAMALDSPTEKEIEQAAAVIYRIFMDKKAGKISDKLFEEVRRITKEEGKTPKYLLHIQRSLLSLNDFMESKATKGLKYVTDEDFQRILIAAFKSIMTPENLYFGAFVKMGMNDPVAAKEIQSIMMEQEECKRGLLEIRRALNP